MSTDLVPVADLDKMAHAISASKLFGIQNKEQALALMLVAQAEGLHPATAARDYHIIQGRPALKADAMLARYLASGGKVEWHEHTDTKVAATFSHPQGGSLKIDWDIERAKKAGLAGKDNWAKYPRQMLRARVISEGIRATNPAVAVGMYTPEEVQDFEPAKGQRGAKAKDMGNAEVVPEESAPVQAKSSPEQQPPAAEPAPAAPLINADQAIYIEDRCREVGVTTAKFCKAAGVERIAQVKAADYDRALTWIDKHETASAAR